MAHHKLKLAVLTALTGFGLSGAHQAGASVVYTYVSDQSTYQGTPGTTIPVSLYLKEVVTSPDSSVIEHDGGLFAIGAQVAGPSGSNLATITSQTANSADFGGPASNTLSPTLATFQEAIGTPPAPNVQLGNTGGGAAPSVAGEIYLGKVLITVGSVDTVFTVGAFNDGSGPGGTTLTKAGSDLDAGLDVNSDPLPGVSSGGLSRFVVSAVPEPGSLGVFALGGLLALRRRRA
jgi:hypothetical protein